MDRTLLDHPTTLKQPVATHRLATLIATILMVAILAGIILGIHELAAGAPFLLMDDPTRMLFAIG